MVAGGEGDDAAAALVGGQPRERVVGAAELEGAGALEVFALEEDVGAPVRAIDRARGDDRRAVRDAGDLPGGAFDVGEGRQRIDGEHVGAMRCSAAVRSAVQSYANISGSSGDAGWSSPVARWAHNPKVAGSNPAPATKFPFSIFDDFRRSRFRLHNVSTMESYVADPATGSLLRSRRAEVHVPLRRRQIAMPGELLNGPAGAPRIARCEQNV